MDLDAVLEYLRSLPPMTDAEREALRRSFAYGNITLGNPDVTRETVDQAAERLKSDPTA